MAKSWTQIMLPTFMICVCDNFDVDFVANFPMHCYRLNSITAAQMGMLTRRDGLCARLS